MAATLEVKDLPGGVRALTVSNPARKNALDDGLLEQLDRALTGADEVRAWLLRGAGEGIFSAGYDLTSLSDYQPGTPLPDERLGEVLDALSRHPAPSVALVTGPAIGAGCELAVACDFRVGDARALFAMPPAKIGVVYALKGMQRLIARVGEGRARYMFLTGRRLAADDALRCGLLDVLADDAEAQALALCNELASNAPLAVRGMKQGLALLEEGGGTGEQRAAYEALRRASFNSQDAREGRDAALEKRTPRFRGA
ncbi:MAG: enoyl-CoA hydratase/isomerase family protein [Myxococcota bacterium]|jgi:enoyl-CoA hydratase/carnithine racemase